MLTSSAYWAFGIPLAWFFGMHQGLGVRGLWVGPVVACAYLTIMYNILIFCINWPSLYEEIRERRRVENEERSRYLRESLLAAKTGADDDYTRVD